ncbi:MAG TPA: hypothetical protein VK569_07485 [Bacteroidota bacterium]|nr:hypothetical protein [Bacteroidota bacterium]
MNIEAKERLEHITRKLVDASFAVACDVNSTDEEFRKSVDAVVNHLEKVRARSRVMHLERQMA